MKRIIAVFSLVVIACVVFVCSVSAQINVPVPPTGKDVTAGKSSMINVPVPSSGKSGGSVTNVYKRYTVVRKMNGVDSQARRDIAGLKAEVSELKNSKADKSAVEAGFKATDDRFTVVDQVNNRQDRELNYIYWALLVIPFIILLLALLYFLFGGRNNVVGGAPVVYVPQAVPAALPVPEAPPLPAPNPASVNVPVSITVQPIEIDLSPTLRGPRVNAQPRRTAPPAQ